MSLLRTGLFIVYPHLRQFLELKKDSSKNIQENDNDIEDIPDKTGVKESVPSQNVSKASNVSENESHNVNKRNDSNDLDKLKSEIPADKDSLEDYEARQAERKGEARRIFDELALKNAEENPGTKEVLEPRFREALISSGKFSDADIDVTIKDMENIYEVRRSFLRHPKSLRNMVNLHDNNY